jgi:hypothetical protein
VISSETARSWVADLNRWGDTLKFPKSADRKGERWTAKVRDGNFQIFVTQDEITEYQRQEQAEKDRWEWISTHRDAVRRKVDCCTDVAVLRQVAALLGYDEGTV